jgi:hypothetical protein
MALICIGEYLMEKLSLIRAVQCLIVNNSTASFTKASRHPEEAIATEGSQEILHFALLRSE